MKKKVGFILVATLLLTGVMGVWAFASGPADIFSKITGLTPEKAYELRRESGKRFGEIAAEQGILDEFKQKMLEYKKEIIAKRVEDGLITQEQANEYIEMLEENMANCDGSGRNHQLGKSLGLRFGNCQGKGIINGRQGNGNKSFGRGNRGRGTHMGNCPYDVDSQE